MNLLYNRINLGVVNNLLQTDDTHVRGHIFKTFKYFFPGNSKYIHFVKSMKFATHS